MSRIAWDDQPLGQVPDRILAHALGVRRQTVADNRVERGIISHSAYGDRQHAEWMAQHIEVWVAGAVAAWRSDDEDERIMAPKWWRKIQHSLSTTIELRRVK